MAAEDWFKEGNNWFEKEDYSKALDCYEKWLDADYILDEVISKTILANSEKALQTNPNNAKAWLFKGIAYNGLRNYTEAIKCYDIAIDLKNDYERAYNYKGNVLYDLGKYEEAIQYYDKAMALNPDYARAHYNKGCCLDDLGRKEDAIQCYNKAIELNHDYNNKGLALSDLGRKEDAIQCYDKAIALNHDFALAYNNKGNALSDLGKYEEAIQCYDKAIELNNNLTLAHNNRRIILQMLEEKKRNKDFPEGLKDSYLSLYDSDFFNEVTTGCSKNIKQHCEKIYCLSLKILNVLQIKKEDKHEKGVAHYTYKRVSQILFFDKVKDKEGKEIIDENGNKKPVPFRLNSVTNSNDIQEGKTLFNYLFDNQKMRPQPEQFVAFVGCFMFNYDNLNQFRLYGKEEGRKEGTGISIVMKSDFFSLIEKSPIQQEKRRTSQDDVDMKASLFRCIYIDPETNQVVSVGHRDFHTFYKTGDILYNRENNKDHIKKIAEDIAVYKDGIDKKVEAVKGYLEDLRTAVNKARKKKLDENVICDLLLNLRYLVKHVAFKEEQECRIIKIKRPCESDNEQPIDEDEKRERFYVNYLPVTNYVSKVIFGPKATGMELFQSLLTYQKGFEKVVCSRSTSPLA
ncbi:MAG: tetratricopeptide repeat protein [Candidatus Azobacteroides sp.]|nr:tetratricopeptide repeat protein [Candidatus Azobacteroides sp.]